MNLTSGTLPGHPEPSIRHQSTSPEAGGRAGLGRPAAAAGGSPGLSTGAYLNKTVREPPNKHGRRPVGTGSVEWYEGGRLIEVKGSGGGGGGGRRGQIVGFSPAARRRLMRFIASLDAGRMGDPWFVTLTYPAPFCLAAPEWKANLNRFSVWLRRQDWFGAAVWKLEPQKRGAPHYHLLLFVDPDWVELLRDGALFPRLPWRRPRLRGDDDAAAWLQDAVAWQWHRSVGTANGDHLLAGTQVVPVRSWRGVQHYAAKYVAKLTSLAGLGPEVVDEWGRAGRWWGKWGAWASEQLHADLDDDAFFRLRRVVRRWIKRQTGHKRRVGPTSGVTAFLDQTTTERLLAWSTGQHRPASSYAALLDALRQLRFRFDQLEAEGFRRSAPGGMLSGTDDQGRLVLRGRPTLRDVLDAV